jgi:hypothetical protein
MPRVPYFFPFSFSFLLPFLSLPLSSTHAHSFPHSIEPLFPSFLLFFSLLRHSVTHTYSTWTLLFSSLLFSSSLLPISFLLFVLHMLTHERDGARECEAPERDFSAEILEDQNARNSRVKFLFILVFDFTFIPFVFCKTVWVFWGLI